MISIKSIESEIDRRKLTFLGQLCNLPIEYFVKRLFLNRLYSYKQSPSTVTVFLPDIYRICYKYGLSNYIETFSNCGEFPSKWSWKNKVSEKISAFERNESMKRIRNDVLLRDYLTINNSDQPIKIWLLSRRYSTLSKQCHSAVYLLSKMFLLPYNSVCLKCGLVISNISEHVLLHCLENDSKRRFLWSKIIKQFGVDTFYKLMLHEPRQQLMLLFSGLEQFLNNESEVECCLTFVVNSFHYMSMSNSKT